MLNKFEAFNLSVKLYHSIEKLKINRHLKDQIIRSSSSIALNLAEGSGKKTIKDRKKYFHISLGSLRETEATLILARATDPILLDLIDKLGAIIYRLCYPKNRP